MNMRDAIARQTTINIEREIMYPQRLNCVEGHVISQLKRDDRHHIRIVAGGRTLILRACINGDLDVYEEVTIAEHMQLRPVTVPASTTLKAVDII